MGVRWLFVDGVFPVRVARWDLRHYLAVFREDVLLAQVSSLLHSVPIHNFRPLAVHPHPRDGGLFVSFSHTGPHNAPAAIQAALRDAAAHAGGLPSWIGRGSGSIWLVNGTPWREDMNRFPSPLVNVAFEGPDVPEETLYHILRPCGLINDISSPSPVPPGTPRSSTVSFKSFRSATIARNVIHGLVLPSGTRLRVTYERPIKAHAVRDWLTGHPRIVLPVLLFLLGTLTYTIFDPIRVLMIEGKMQQWFDYRKWSAYTWISNHLDDSPSSPYSQESGNESMGRGEHGWKERTEALSSLRAYLADMPSTVAFLHGPQGSGKTRMLTAVLQESGRRTLTVDCAELARAASDSQLVGALARQTGYRPVFTFLNSASGLIDLASVGLIGQKAGLATSLPDQLRQILTVTTTALCRVSSAYRADSAQRRDRERAWRGEEARRARARRGTWRDGRLDCVAGVGVLSELGGGDERAGEADWEAGWEGREQKALGEENGEKESKGQEDNAVVGGLPIVIIRNFAVRGGGATVDGGREEVLDVLASWAAELAENQIAHVVVVSDNRENAKRLAKALPSKPLNTIALSDADATSALSFVRSKLRAEGVELEYTSSQTTQVRRLGGRASDLESLIHKVRAGQSVEEAVEDIIARGTAELRKSAFGDDVEDAKSLPWAREQAWAILKQLAKNEEVPYHDILLEFPFKGDEAPLRAMEHAELITIGTMNGRPSTIRPGKPVFKYVFERLVNDRVFQATQDIALNERAAAGAESTVAACERELALLREIGAEGGWWSWFSGGGAVGARGRYLLVKMGKAEEKIEGLERRNEELKKLLKKAV